MPVLAKVDACPRAVGDPALAGHLPLPAALD